MHSCQVQAHKHNLKWAWLDWTGRTNMQHCTIAAVLWLAWPWRTGRASLSHPRKRTLRARSGSAGWQVILALRCAAILVNQHFFCWVEQLEMLYAPRKIISRLSMFYWIFLSVSVVFLCSTRLRCSRCNGYRLKVVYTAFNLEYFHLLQRKFAPAVCTFRQRITIIPTDLSCAHAL
jgi:hypothetical protein